MTERSTSATPHRYLDTGRFLLRLDQGLVAAARHLGFGYRSNRLSALGLPRRMAWRMVLRVAATRGGHEGDDGDGVVELPATGQLGLHVHRGAKIFDFDDLSVTKVFDSGASDAERRREIDACRRASPVSAAPAFLGEGNDGERAWYREELIRGIHATDPVYLQSVSLLDDCYPYAEQCLLELAVLEPAIKRDPARHANDLSDGAFRERWRAAGQDDAVIREIDDYMNRVARWLELAADGPVQLVPAHGDFSLVNALATDDGLRFIDWEGIAPGGLYSDLFNFAFVERYYGRIRAGFAELLAELFARYREACRSRLPGLRREAETAFDVARRQYYLERLRILVDRQPSAHLAGVIQKSIAMFEAFDRERGTPLN